MDNPEDLTFSRLELCTYRYLQQMAKTMRLPCNVKKVYLIEMIRAKKYRTPEDLDAIILRIQEERRQQAQNRKPIKRKKKRVQGTEISSTSYPSPPISLTPMRSSDYITYGPSIRQTILKNQPKPNILRPTITKRTESDRVLRSSQRMRPNYSILNLNNSVIGVIKAQNVLQHSQDMEEKQYQLSLALERQSVVDCVVRRTPINYGCVQRQQQEFDGLNGERQLVPVARRSDSPSSPAKRQRRLSGIYPLKPPERPYYQYVPSVGFRRQDVRLSKFNALQKCMQRRPSNERISLLKTIDRSSPLRYERRVIIPKSQTIQTKQIPNVRDIVNYTIDRPTLSNSSTESARESSLEREHNESVIYKNVDPTNVTRNLNKYGENTNCEAEYTESFCAGDNVDRNIQTGMTTDVEMDYPNMSAITDTYPENHVTEIASNNPNNFTVYYHKKIRAERVRSQRTYAHREQRVEEGLPRITDVFSQFNDVQYKNLTQPLYVQVSQESERALPYRLHNTTQNTTKYDNNTMLNNNNNTMLNNNTMMLNNNTSIVNNSTTMLESIFNFKNDFLTNQPLGRIPPTSETLTTFCTSTVTTAVALPTAACEDYSTQSFERPSQHYNIAPEPAPRLYDYLRVAEQERRDFRCREVLSPSSDSIGSPSSRGPPTNVTIPEMLEDALELISQDGDYMERIGEDVRTQCVLCDWAGPKVVLECHIKNEHSSEIVHERTPEWVVRLPVGSLVRARSTRLLQYNARVFLLRAACAGNCFAANLTILPSESEEGPKFSSLTVYNKVSGKPFTWEGPIPYLPDTIYGDHGDVPALQLDITSLDLLPNSANLKLINGELVTNSVAKVVVGQPELDSIEIVVYVKVFD